MSGVTFRDKNGWNRVFGAETGAILAGVADAVPGVSIDAYGQGDSGTRILGILSA